MSPPNGWRYATEEKIGNRVGEVMTSPYEKESSQWQEERRRGEYRGKGKSFLLQNSQKEDMIYR